MDFISELQLKIIDILPALGNMVGNYEMRSFCNNSFHAFILLKRKPNEFQN